MARLLDGVVAGDQIFDGSGPDLVLRQLFAAECGAGFGCCVGCGRLVVGGKVTCLMTL